MDAGEIATVRQKHKKITADAWIPAPKLEYPLLILTLLYGILRTWECCRDTFSSMHCLIKEHHQQWQSPHPTLLWYSIACSKILHEIRART
eukprot:15337154-Ditylum_brightwellii.AAC.1